MMPPSHVYTITSTHVHLPLPMHSRKCSHSCTDAVTRNQTHACAQANTAGLQRCRHGVLLPSAPAHQCRPAVTSHHGTSSLKFWASYRWATGCSAFLGLMAMPSLQSLKHKSSSAPVLAKLSVLQGAQPMDEQPFITPSFQLAPCLHPHSLCDWEHWCREISRSLLPSATDPLPDAHLLPGRRHCRHDTGPLLPEGTLGCGHSPHSVLSLLCVQAGGHLEHSSSLGSYQHSNAQFIQALNI